MIVRILEEARNSERCVKAPNGNWESVRLSLKDDGMGFSFHITTIKAGSETHIWYQNHLETVYCISGEGEVETVADGKIWPIKPGSVYILNENDEHYLRAYEGSDMVLACAFNPPLSGLEVHDENGVYPVDEG